MKDKEDHFPKMKCQFTKRIQETQMLVYMITKPQNTLKRKK